MGAERKIIFECRVGSHLYGTNHEGSDEDFYGVFLPSDEDLLGVQGCPSEWREDVKLSQGERNSADDVDRKYFSIKRFIQLAAQGQPGQLEMLFVPDHCVVKKTPEWQRILDAKQWFISRHGMKPFLGFAVSQAHKATIKGANLNKIQALIEACGPLVEANSRTLLSDHFKGGAKSQVAGVDINYLCNDHGDPLVEVAGRRFNIGILMKSFLISLVALEARYGRRVTNAASKGYDYKSLMHACRLVSEAEEFLATGNITLPRPDAAFLLKVKEGQVDRPWFDFLYDEIDRLSRYCVPKSPLKEHPNRSKLNELCIDILRSHLAKV